MPAWLRWSILTALVLALILVPFALWEEPLTAWSSRILASGQHRTPLNGVVVALLASDVLLPIPSSFVAAGAVALLGPLEGGLGIALGMTLGAWLGYGLGRWGGEPIASRVAGTAELTRARRLLARHGAWLLLVCRGVPVLAEASTLLAGTIRHPPWHFAIVTGLGNLGLAAAYAAIGALRLTGTWALLTPFMFGIAVPALALLLVRGLPQNG